MKSFTLFYESYLLQEASLMQIPNKVMGLQSMDLIPEQQPYGFWVDKSGNFITVPLMSHSDVGYAIIWQAKDYAEANNIDLTVDTSSAYRTLFSNGWMRVVSEPGDLLRYELTPGAQATPNQLKFLNIVKDKYGFEGISSRS